MAQNFWIDFEENISGDKIPKLFNLIKKYFDDKNNLTKNNKYFSLNENLEEETHYGLFKNIFDPLINKIKEKISWFTVFFYDEIHKNHDFVIFFPDRLFEGTSFSKIYNLANDKEFYTALDNSSSLLFKETNKQQIKKKLLYLTYSRNVSFPDFGDLAYQPVKILKFKTDDKIQSLDDLIKASDKTYNEKPDNNILNYLSGSDFYAQFNSEEEEVQRYQKIFRYFYWLTLLKKAINFNHYYYFPASLLSKRSVGGIVIATKSKFSKNQLILCQSSSNRVFSLLSNQALGEYSRQTLYYATKSAIAAIMSRNMSHNLGSHVLSYASTNLNHPFDMQVLMEYMQERMDFIAQITAEPPQWTMPMRFVGQLMRNFYKQRLLLKYIAKSEGLTAKEFNNEDIKDKLQIIILNKEGKEIIPYRKDKDFKDPLVAIPGGITGAHAFYTILENIIRNAARHSYKTISEEGLKIFIKIDDSDEKSEYVTVTIFDNVTTNENTSDGKGIDDLRERINQPFIKDDGTLQPENWGLFEIKIGAGFLQKKDSNEIGSEIKNLDDSFIKLIPLKEEEGKMIIDTTPDVNSFIGYEFKIYKPKHVLIICEGNNTLKDKNNELNQEGIYLKNIEEIEKEGKLDYEFVLYPQSIKEPLKTNFPPRRFEYNEIQQQDNGRNQISIKINFGSAFEMTAKDDTLKENLYKLWINKLLENKDKKVCLEVSPYEKSSGGSSVSDLNAYKYSVELLLKSLSEQDGAYTVFRDFLNNENPDVANDLYKKLVSKDKSVITKLINKKSEVVDFFKKYEEDIETLPDIFKERRESEKKESEKKEYKKYFDGNDLNDNNDECNKAVVKIKYKRHASTKTEDEHYIEALSGSQSYFKEIENFVLYGSTDNVFAYSLIETGLLGITVVDERVFDFCKGNNIINRRFKNMNILVYKKLEDIKKSENNEILIVHQGLYEEGLITVEDGKVKVKDKFFKYFFITSGSGDIKVKNIPENLKAKFIPFSNVRSALMRQYPEKYILIQTLMKI